MSTDPVLFTSQALLAKEEIQKKNQMTYLYQFHWVAVQTGKNVSYLYLNI